MTSQTASRAICASSFGERAYDILVGPGLIEQPGAEILPLMRRRQAVIVTDETVARHYLAPLRDSLAEPASHTIRLSCRPARRPKISPISAGSSRRSSPAASSAVRCWWRWAAVSSAT